MKRFSLFLAIFLIIVLRVFARDGIPHITQLSAEVRNNLIRLTWVDSPDAHGPVFIFRSTRPFGRTIPAHIRPVVVRYGNQFFIDDSDGIDNLYFFVAASDAAGQRFDYIIPHINILNVNLSITDREQVPLIPPAPPPIPGISNLRARAEGERVIISFDISGPRRNAVLYRSRQAIRHPQDLRNALIVQTGFDSPFIDFPFPGLPWYYALIFEDDITAGNINIRPGINTTVTPVTIVPDDAAAFLALDGIRERAMRPIPLPIMSLGGAVSERYLLSDFSREIPLSEEMQRIIRNSGLPPSSMPESRNPRIFRVDLQAPTGGEDSVLFQIVNDFFVNHNWEGARDNLQLFLSLPRSGEVEARARFYLGQALYFIGDYRGALFEFLTIRSAHPVETNAWIDSVLTAMVR